MIVSHEGSALGQDRAGLSLIFAGGTRPRAADIVRLADAHAEGAGGFAVSHRPAEREGWLELLSSGLAFDLGGLAPAESAPLPQQIHRYGFPSPEEAFAVEAIRLAPGSHLAAGAHLLPIVRTMCALAARMARLPGIGAVAWHPARTAIEPELFVRSIDAWLSGGAFPALGLVALTDTPEGGLASEGLAFFVGQELLIDPAAGLSSRDSARLAIRLINLIVAEGPQRIARDFTALDGEPLSAKPSPDGRLLRIGRAG
ncbi:MAG: hypothetical protein JF593_00420 [Novosphingobium sp.]|nr:hypothetical protein [Novosphingobium sp.]